MTGWSAPARIVVGPLADADWDGADTVWAPPVPPTPTYVNATLSCDIEIQSARAGVFVRTSPDAASGYMWQLNPGTQGLLRQHSLVNGVYTVLRDGQLDGGHVDAYRRHIAVASSAAAEWLDTFLKQVPGQRRWSTAGQ